MVLSMYHCSDMLDYRSLFTTMIEYIFDFPSLSKHTRLAVCASVRRKARTVLWRRAISSILAADITNGYGRHRCVSYLYQKETVKGNTNVFDIHFLSTCWSHMSKWMVLNMCRHSGMLSYRLLIEANMQQWFFFLLLCSIRV